MSDDVQLTFEDKRKENFEAGRLELERRRRARLEQQEREAVSLLRFTKNYKGVQRYTAFFGCFTG